MWIPWMGMYATWDRKCGHVCYMERECGHVCEQAVGGSFTLLACTQFSTPRLTMPSPSGEFCAVPWRVLCGKLKVTVPTAVGAIADTKIATRHHFIDMRLRFESTVRMHITLNTFSVVVNHFN